MDVIVPFRSLRAMTHTTDEMAKNDVA